MSREWHRFLNRVWIGLCARGRREELTPLGEVLRSLRTRRIHPEYLIEGLCWLIFLENQPSVSAERLAALSGHDWRSLKNLLQGIEQFLTERDRLEALAGRPFATLRPRAERLQHAARSIQPSAVLSVDLMRPSPAGLEENHQLLAEAIPKLTSRLERWRNEQREEIERILAQLLEGLGYAEIAALLNATAEYLGFDSEFDPDALKMRHFRAL